MTIYRGPGGTGEAHTDADVTEVRAVISQAEDYRDQAATSATNAAASAAASAASATSSSNYATNSANSAADAEASAVEAAALVASVEDVADQVVVAQQAAIDAAASEAAAAVSETNAASSASSAATSATAASTSATNAASSASSASTSAGNASSSASAASASATNAATQAGYASTYATNASNSATAAASSATTASNAASSASTSATNASNSAASASVSASSASTSASNAATSATSAASSATAAASSETNAASSATSAASSASAASTSASAAATSASNAATSETNAASSASSAASSATSAASSAAAAAASLDSFDDRYLGSKTSDPTVDNDGNALVTGALYYNSVEGEMRVYDGSVWIAASAASQAILVTYEYVATAGQTTFSGNDANGVSLAYTAGSIIVTLNGVKLRPGNDYTASNGTSVVLVTAAAAGDDVVIDAFSTFEVANTYTQAQVDAALATKMPINGPAFSAYRSTNQSLSNGAFTKIAFDSEEFDTNSNYDSVTNYRFTPTVAGYYLISAESRLVGTTLSDWSLNIYKNGASFKRGNGATYNTNAVQVSATALIYFNGSTDYAEVYAYTGAVSGNATTGGAEYTFFQGVLVRAA